MKIEFLAINYRNLAPTAGNRLNITLMNAAAYQRGMYLKWLEVTQGRVYDTTFTERPISSVDIAIVTSDSGWNTRPVSGTLDTNALYGGSGFGISLDPKNCPGKSELGDIYIPSSSTITVNMQLYCPGIVLTDVVDVRMRLAFEFEATESYFSNQFDINDTRY